MNPELILSSFGIKMADLTGAPTTSKKEAAARVPRIAYEKRKTRAAQVTATREQAAFDGEV
jgi:hypothetical protein